MANILANHGKELLLGNEAIVRGLIEAGVKFASTYPGTPSSEIGNNLEDIADKTGMYFEFSTNEKVALEASAAAASSGVRSFVFMKHVGLNVAADPLMTLAYAGVKGGMLVLSADDPSCHSSQNEQDNRYYSLLSLLPMMEPSTPAEAKDMMKEAYEISETLELPLIFRTTTRVNHARGIVEYQEPKNTPARGMFEKDPAKYVNIPAFSKPNRVRLLGKNRKAKELSEMSALNFMDGDGKAKTGVITSGVSYTYVKEYLPNVDILKLGFTNPLPETKIADFIRGKEKIIVVEELEPYLEDQVLRICGQNGLGVPVYGKRTGHLPREWEFSPDVMKGLNVLTEVRDTPVPLPGVDIKLPARPPTLCAGCPHRGIYAATKKAVGRDDVIYCSDIGCYTLGVQPPFNTADFIVCMGGGAGAAGGFSETTDQKPIAFLGDSTFFHSGIPPLVSAKFNNHKFTMVILDNRTTAMTGHQPNPGTGRHFGGRNTEPMDIEAIVRSIGPDFIEVVDPYDVSSAVDVMKRAIACDGVSVVISKRPCPLELKKHKQLEPKVCTVDQSKCIQCFTCLKMIACPALIKKDGKVDTDPSQCIGCGMCASVCPKKAIEVKK
ncbi:MAG: indolepyruvate ferredoxin oxidoreductase subunit alpha [Candidatus Methanomethylophilaceae archaeon]